MIVPSPDHDHVMQHQPVEISSLSVLKAEESIVVPAVAVEVEAAASPVTGPTRGQPILTPLVPLLLSPDVNGLVPSVELIKLSC
jgi:hypothetical protein